MDIFYNYTSTNSLKERKGTINKYKLETASS